MEGIGYWIFLLVIYLISGLMRKRRQRMGSQDFEEVQKESNGLEFFDFPGDLLEEDVESKSEETIVQEAPQIGKVQPEPVVPDWLESDQELIVEETAEIETEDPEPGAGFQGQYIRLSRKDSIAYKIKPTPYFYGGDVFENLQDVRKAIVMKEILDPPRALKRRIR